MTTRPDRNIGGGAARVLVVGGVGVDDALYLPAPLRAGGWTQAVAQQRSPAGSGATVAAALASAGLLVTLAGAVGTDANGDWLASAVTEAGVRTCLARVDGPSPRSLVLVDPDGGRTIVGINADLLDHATDALPASAQPGIGGVVVIPAWRSQFRRPLTAAAAAGSRTVVGLRALADSTVCADVAVGSERELGDFDPAVALDRFDLIVVTAGSAGGYAMTARDRVDYGAVPVRAVDATGAGDTFLAGIVVGVARGASLSETLAVAAAWGAAAACSRGTQPPPYAEVVAASRGRHL